jgi:hypothetical protein
LILDFFGRKLTYGMNTIFLYVFSTLSEPSTPLSFLPTAAYLIPEMGGNDFFYAYFRGASPQTVIDEIVPDSLNLLVSAVEVKETCQQPLYLYPNGIETN